MLGGTRNWQSDIDPVKLVIGNSHIREGILYKVDPNPDLNLQKKRTLYQNSWYELKTHV